MSWFCSSVFLFFLCSKEKENPAKIQFFVLPPKRFREMMEWEWFFFFHLTIHSKKPKWEDEREEKSYYFINGIIRIAHFSPTNSWQSPGIRSLRPREGDEKKKLINFYSGVFSLCFCRGLTIACLLSYMVFRSFVLNLLSRLGRLGHINPILCELNVHLRIVWKPFRFVCRDSCASGEHFTISIINAIKELINMYQKFPDQLNWISL